MGKLTSFIIIFLIIILIISMSVFGYLLFNFLQKPSQTSVQDTGITQNSSLSPSSQYYPDECRELLPDDYALPDFNNFKSVIQNEQLLKDLPSEGSLKIMFFHFSAGCRRWDKTYTLTKNNIEEKNSNADVDIIILSDYVSQIAPGNICEVIQDARENNDFAQTLNIGRSKFYVRYSGMMKYKECFGF
ncbi:hypothetical protein HYW76_00745 [Candidatus Pacearchaeota archaeon]|nr:hypothetical protein [Candidatus Pacearchaeota archaeon]